MMAMLVKGMPMSHDRPPNLTHQLPATFKARHSWRVWLSMAFITVIALIPFWVALMSLGSDMPDTFIETHMLTIVMGLCLLAFPLLFVLSRLRGLPLLVVDHGRVQLTSIFGRVQVLHLSDYTAVSLGAALTAKGYHPRLEAVPHTPGQKMQTLPLRPFVNTRAEAEALIALIRHAAGERPALSPVQSAQPKRVHRREWKSLATIIGGSLALLILLNWPR